MKMAEFFDLFAGKKDGDFSTILSSSGATDSEDTEVAPPFVEDSNSSEETFYFLSDPDPEDTEVALPFEEHSDLSEENICFFYDPDPEDTEVVSEFEPYRSNDLSAGSTVIHKEEWRWLEEKAGKIQPPPDISQGLGKSKIKKDLVDLSRFVISKMNLRNHHEKIVFFDGTCWVHPTQNEFFREIRRILETHNLTDNLTIKDYREIHNLILLDPEIKPQPFWNPPPHRVNLADGTLDLRTMKLYPHNPHDEFTWCLDVCFDEIQNPRSKGIFEEFVANAGNGDEILRTQLLELTALVLLRCTTKHFFVALGPSHTGKSEFARFLMELVGRENTENIESVQNLSVRFTSSQLEGRALVTALDMRNEPIPAGAISALKQLVGDDPIRIERKGVDAFTIFQKPVVLFATNYPLKIPHIDQEEALLNRMVTLHFSNPVPEEKQTQHLFRQLLEEKAYIIGEALRAYRDLLNRNMIPTRSDVPEELAPREANAFQSSVKDFLAEYCELEEDAEITTDDLYSSYSAVAEEKNFIRASKKDFGIALSKVLDVYQDQIRYNAHVGPRRIRGYKGIRLSQK